jgi:hypothetical protein
MVHYSAADYPAGSITSVSSIASGNFSMSICMFSTKKPAIILNSFDILIDVFSEVAAYPEV